MVASTTIEYGDSRTGNFTIEPTRNLSWRNMNPAPVPGSLIKLRSATWKVLGSFTLKRGYRAIHCRGVSGIVRDKEARFVWDLEKDARVLDPAAVRLVEDTSPGLIDTKLFLEAAFRQTPTTTRQPLTLGRAAIDDLAFQHVPVRKRWPRTGFGS